MASELLFRSPPALAENTRLRRRVHLTKQQMMAIFRFITGQSPQPGQDSALPAWPRAEPKPAEEQAPEHVEEMQLDLPVRDKEVVAVKQRSKRALRRSRARQRRRARPAEAKSAD